MALMNLSYLNYEWNSEIVQKKWQKSKYTEKCGKDSLYYGQSAFTYIRNRLGYRFLIKVDRLGLSEDKRSIDLTARVDNVGFGYLTRKKTVEMLLVDAGGDIAGGGVVSREWQGSGITARLDAPDVAAGESRCIPAAGIRYVLRIRISTTKRSKRIISARLRYRRGSSASLKQNRDKDSSRCSERQNAGRRSERQTSITA